MARWNHFKKETKAEILFKDLLPGYKFRVNLWRGKRRACIVCVKTGRFTFQELRSKKVHELNSVELYKVFAY